MLTRWRVDALGREAKLPEQKNWQQRNVCGRQKRSRCAASLEFTDVCRLKCGQVEIDVVGRATEMLSDVQTTLELVRVRGSKFTLLIPLARLHDNRSESRQYFGWPRLQSGHDQISVRVPVWRLAVTLRASHGATGGFRCAFD